MLGYEEPQELFLQEVGIQDYRDYEVVGKSRLSSHRPESVFGYLYHEFVPLFQSNPNASDREMTAHCIVTGQMPHLVPHWPVEPYPFPSDGGFEEWRGDVPAGRFVTAFFGVLDPHTGSFTYVNAGHNPPLQYRCREDRLFELVRRGPALGVIDDQIYQQRRVLVDPGDFGKPVDQGKVTSALARSRIKYARTAAR